MKFSANLGFLWTELPLPEAIRAAKAAGFDAVECHWPYDTPHEDVVTALRETGLPMLGLNTWPGRGETGLAALPGREGEARAAIDQAVAYARAVGARHVHVMAGAASGRLAEAAFVSNLQYACEKARGCGLAIVIEPLNAGDAPGYFLRTTDQAIRVIEATGASNLKLMFDCYHVALTEGDLLARLTDVISHVGHIQFAAVPDRGPPDQGEVEYARVFDTIARLGYDRPLGAEYRPGGPTEASLGWLEAAKRG